MQYRPYTAEQFRKSEEQRTRKHFPLIAFADIKLGTERRYLIKGLIPRVGIMVAWGPPKCGKSFWTLDATMHIAMGWPYRGRRTQQGTVVYCALEGAKGFEARVEAFRQRRKVSEAPFYLMPINLILVNDHKDLIASIKDRLGDATPSTVVIDTLNRGFQGSESKDEDMTAFIQAADAVREAFNCVVIIVHHCGIDGTRPRGHTSLSGAIEAQIAINRDESKNVIATVEYMKEGPEGDVIVSRLEKVVVGQDEDGDEISSMVVEPADGAQIKRAPKELPAAVRTALRALREALDEGGYRSLDRTNVPPDLNVVTVDQWRERCFRCGISDAGDRARYQAFQRARERLIKEKIVAAWGDETWLIVQGG
jgi:hypothetical protein